MKTDRAPAACRAWSHTPDSPRRLHTHRLHHEHDDREYDHDDDRGPGQDVPNAAVGVTAHHVAVARDVDHAQQQDGQQHAVESLANVLM